MNNENKSLSNITILDYYKLMRLLFLNQIRFDGMNIIYHSQEVKDSVGEGEEILKRWAGSFLAGSEYLLYESILQEFSLVILTNEKDVFGKDTLTDKLLLRYNIITLYIKYMHKKTILTNGYLSVIGIELINLIGENYETHKNDVFFDHIIKSLPNLFIIDYNQSNGAFYAPYNNTAYNTYVNLIEKYKLHIVYEGTYTQSLKALLTLLENQKLNGTAKFINTKGKSNLELLNRLISKIEDLLESINEKEKINNSSDFLSKFLDNKDIVLQNLKENIIGQDEHINDIFPSIAKVILGLNMRPSTFLFSGKSGVGKTRLAEEIAKQLGSEACVINLGNFHSEHTLSTIVGAPPGYLGFTQDTLLEKYKNNLERNYNPGVIPVIVFDEIEKADSSIQNLWLELFDRGTVTLLSGKILDFSRSIIIMTSNLGANLGEKIGFATMEDEEAKKEENSKRIKGEITKHIKPEVMNRIDKVIVFNDLNEEDYLKIKNKVLLDTLQYTISNNKILSEYCNKKNVDMKELYLKVSAELPKFTEIEISNIRLYQKEIENAIYEAIINNI